MISFQYTRCPGPSDDPRYMIEKVMNMGHGSKRLVVVMMLAIALAASAFASDTATVNHFEPLIGDEEYGALLEHVFNDEGLDGALTRYADLVAAIPYRYYDPWMMYASLSRACLIVGKYGSEKGRDDIAQAYFTAADQQTELARQYGAPESVTDVLSALSDSFWYLLDSSMSRGMGFSKKVDKAWDAHPEDLHVALLKGAKYQSAPGIVGGSKKKGIALFHEIEENTRDMEMAVWDRFSLYQGLAISEDQMKNGEKALEYAEKAYEIYRADPEVNRIREKYL